MILVDAGPLIALLDERDRQHARCRLASEQLIGPMVTTWPAFTEAMYLLGADRGWRGQSLLWRMVQQESLLLVEISSSMVTRIPLLMERYKDLPMDLADASLVALAEERRLRRIFTLDKDFRIYALKDGTSLDVVP